jgi:hypothetical protein
MIFLYIGIVKRTYEQKNNLKLKLEKINKEIALLEKKIFIRENSNAGVTVHAVRFLSSRF